MLLLRMADDEIVRLWGLLEECGAWYRTEVKGRYE